MNRYGKFSNGSDCAIVALHKIICENEKSVISANKMEELFEQELEKYNKIVTSDPVGYNDQIPSEVLINVAKILQYRFNLICITDNFKKNTRNFKTEDTYGGLTGYKYDLIDNYAIVLLCGTNDEKNYSGHYIAIKWDDKFNNADILDELTNKSSWYGLELSTKISPTIPSKISTTIPSKISTTIPSKISTTIPSKISTTIPSTISTTIPSKISPTIPPKISPTIPSKISPTIPSKISPTIPPKISPTIPEISPTIPKISPTIPKIASYSSIKSSTSSSSGPIKYTSSTTSYNTTKGTYCSNSYVSPYNKTQTTSAPKYVNYYNNPYYSGTH